MLIEFRCGNYSSFNKKTGQYAVCGQKMSASSEDAGLLVTCPKCQRDCEVPIPKRTSETPSGQKSRSRPKAPPTLEEEARIAKANQTKKAKVPLPTTAAPPKKKIQRCPKCGGVLDQGGVCNECRWVKPRFAKARQSLDEMEMEPAGMMLWFSQILSEGIPMKVLCRAMNVAIPLLLFAMMAFALLIVGGLFGGLLFLLLFLSLLLYAGLVFKGYQFLRSGHAKLAWFQKPFWYGLLGWCRSRNWKSNDARYRNRNIVSFQGDPITDEQLLQHKELKSAQVLDLGGTMITDATIEQLYKLKHLQCLVVKDTSVSHLAVTRLQQSFPKLWIWH
jgi:hypothetical protein